MEPWIQWAVNGFLSLVIIVGAGFIKMLLSMMRDHAIQDAREAEKLESLRIRVAEKYVMREELEKVMRPVNEALQRIEDKLYGR